jgi:hypothetical protein
MDVDASKKQRFYFHFYPEDGDGKLCFYETSVTTILTARSIFFKVGFKDLTPVVMKSSVFWNITPCSPLKIKGRFGGTFLLNLQLQRISQAC